MSITSPDDRLSEYNPVVATTDFPAGFPVFDNDDLIVVHDGVVRDAFAVSATYVEGISTNAKAVFAIGITGHVQVVGARDPHRTNRFGHGPLPPRDLNLALDTIEAEMQEVSRDVGRAVKAAFGADAQDLPPPETGKVIGWDSGKLANQSVLGVGSAVFGAVGIDVAAATTKQSAQTAIGLPLMEATKYPRVKADGTEYEGRTPAQVASDINVQQRNIDGGFTMSATSTSQSWGGPFGGLG